MGKKYLIELEPFEVLVDHDNNNENEIGANGFLLCLFNFNRNLHFGLYVCAVNSQIVQAEFQRMYFPHIQQNCQWAMPYFESSCT